MAMHEIVEPPRVPNLWYVIEVKQSAYEIEDEHGEDGEDEEL